MKFVRGQRKEIDCGIAETDRDFPRRLHGVGVKEHAFLAAYRGNLFDRKQNPCFVVSPHHRNECRFRANRRLQLGKIDISIPIHTNKRDLAATFREILARLQYGTVFDSARDHMLPTWITLQSRVDYRIVRFRATAREHNFRRLTPEQRCEPFAGQIDSLSRFRGKRITARRIAVMLPQKRHHLLDHARVELRRRIVIEVNQLVCRSHRCESLGTESPRVKSLEIAK